MSKDLTPFRAMAKASSLACGNKAFLVVVRFAVVVLISILISHPHADPV